MAPDAKFTTVLFDCDIFREPEQGTCNLKGCAEGEVVLVANEWFHKEIFLRVDTSHIPSSDDDIFLNHHDACTLGLDIGVRSDRVLVFKKEETK